MKNVILLVAAIMATVSISQAQTAQEAQVKNEIKAVSKRDPNAKAEKKNLRMELHKLEGQDVSNSTKNQFATDFGNIPNAKWKRSNYYDEVAFMKNGVSSTAFYDFKSQLVGTTMHEKFTDLPANAQKAINDKYKGYAKGEVLYYEDNVNNDTDMILFDRQFDDADNYFVEISKDGKNSVLQVTKGGNVNYFTATK
ncbi:hypothetical protein LNQ49_22825 [Flavobacterium sp. F-65]|jgi:hypothetical protein|uniref:Beta-lactamase-inhibitor-like, PepSY-like n=1 Tax=Flavobacterium pisciphilum TaxID=2893755 RepID=A0ABS8N088_9FLAO|nr:hypothetical protein [Flavobacterium sp. F-65]MCC9074427.1 hypothetical protein [Flavobacterium sp. F-65]